jgi:hypothetical protein
VFESALSGVVYTALIPCRWGNTKRLANMDSATHSP